MTPELVMPSKVKVTTATITVFGARSVKEWVQGAPHPVIKQQSIPGQVSYGDCKINFGPKRPRMGVKIKELCFGDQLYIGVTPIRSYGDSVFQCTVSRIEDITP